MKVTLEKGERVVETKEFVVRLDEGEAAALATLTMRGALWDRQTAVARVAAELYNNLAVSGSGRAKENRVGGGMAPRWEQSTF